MSYFKGQGQTFYLFLFPENNIDGLQFTKQWLHESYTALKKLTESTQASIQGASANTDKPKVTSTAVMNHAFVQLLIWQSNKPFPEVKNYQ